MLLRRSLHTPIRFLKFNGYAREFKTKANDSSPLHHPESTPISPHTATNEKKPDKIPLFAHVEKIKTEVQSMDNHHKFSAVSRKLERARVWEQSLQWKLKTGHDAAIERAASFILSNDPQSFEESTRVLLLQDNVIRALSLSTLERALALFETQGYWLSAVALARTVRRLISPKQMQDTTHLLSLIQPHILQHLKSVRPADTHSVSYIPPSIVTTSLIYIHALLRVDKEQGISLFRILIDADYIPSAAMVDSSSTQPLEQIIDMTLVKAGLYWNCQEVSETILLHALSSSSAAADPFVIQNAIDCLYTLLSSPSENNLIGCLDIMRYLHAHAPIPDSLIRQFYDCAVDLDIMSAAEGLYSFSRNPRADLYHHYPPPQGRALSKLMEYSAAKSRNIHLVRTLASEVVEDHLPIPLNSRSRFIHIVARKGIASTARALWELYTRGKDGSMVYGDSGLMVRMVSLFTNLSYRLLETEGDSEADGLDDGKSMGTSDDAQLFVHHVMSKFKEYHEPWIDADHRAITSYARACFVVGKKTEGFRALRALVERLEMPDLYDVNVALSALAKDSPKAAARAIKNMEKRGLQPDSVSFGTVLHYASVQNCQEVVAEMIERVLGADMLKSDVRVFGALIRALVQPKPDDNRESRILKLQSVWKLIHQIQNPQLPTQIGNYLVTLALEAEDATLAFKFWDVLLKGRAEWGDPHQRVQRGAIISLAQEQNEREEISGGYLRTLNRELNRF